MMNQVARLLLTALPAVINGIKEIAIKRDKAAIAENKQSKTTKAAIPGGLTAGAAVYALGTELGLQFTHFNNESEIVAAVVSLLVSLGMYFYRGVEK